MPMHREKQKNEENETTHDRACDTSRTMAEQAGAFCPNCGARLAGRKCKLECPTPGCGYRVTCSEW